MICCNRTHLQNVIIGVYQTDSVCPSYCMEVDKISELPIPDQCSSKYAFVINAPLAAYGGFTYQSGAWVSIFDLATIRYNGLKVEYIDGRLLPEFRLEINGILYSADEVQAGINFILRYGEGIETPIQFNYHKTGCTLHGQVLI